MSGLNLHDIVHKAAAATANATECEAKQNGKQQDAYGIVPIEKFVAPVLGGKFLGVAPAASANHCNEAEKHGNAVTVDNVHNVGIRFVKKLFSGVDKSLGCGAVGN